jgi:hypothetical protein
MVSTFHSGKGNYVRGKLLHSKLFIKTQKQLPFETHFFGVESCDDK